MPFTRALMILWGRLKQNEYQLLKEKREREREKEAELFQGHILICCTLSAWISLILSNACSKRLWVTNKHLPVLCSNNMFQITHCSIICLECVTLKCTDYNPPRTPEANFEIINNCCIWSIWKLIFNCLKFAILKNKQLWDCEIKRRTLPFLFPGGNK